MCVSKLAGSFRIGPAFDVLVEIQDRQRLLSTNRQIAERMFLAEKTVKNYVSNLLAKLGMSRRTEAAALAARLVERHRNEM